MKIKSLKISHKGKRSYMEDELFSTKFYCSDQLVYVSGIFDGHGGGTCSKFLKKHFVTIFQRIFRQHECQLKKIKQCLYDTVARLQQVAIRGLMTSGSTCNIVVIVDSTLYICNVGDSRTLMCMENSNKSIQITKDHSPTDPIEKKYIYDHGGFVENKRVNGSLAMSRAIGDLHLSQYISPIPDIYQYDNIHNIKFIVQASDGLFESLENQTIIDMILNKDSTDSVLLNILNACFEEGSTDNVAIILILLYFGQ
jgi:serine/threonine protein phosphatase PrpC